MSKSTGVGRGNHIKPERKKLLDELVADGWPLLQMRRTHGFGPDTVKYHYPDYKGMTLSDAGKLGRQMAKVDEALAKHYPDCQKKASE